MAFVSTSVVGKTLVGRGSVVSSFAGCRVAVPRRAMRARLNTPRMDFEMSDGETFDSNPLVVVLALAGWLIPSSIPAPIALTKGSGLTQAFIASMQDNLSRYPKGPSLDDPFWVLMTLWHLGLFSCLIFGSIGYNGNKAGLFK